MNTKAWLCDEHWERCLKNDPCATCPSRPENKNAVEQLAKLQPEEHAMLSSAIINKLGQIDLELYGDSNGCRGYSTRLALLEEKQRWTRQRGERYATWAGITVSTLIATIAICISIYEVMTR